jgi:hypothetical protein
MRLRLRNLVVILLIAASAALLTMVQLGPSYQDYQLSVRSEGFAYAEATRHSLSPQMLKHFVLPLHFQANFDTDPSTLQGFFPGNGQIPWLLTIYPGFIIAPLALIGLLLGFSKRFLLWLVIFMVCTALALGYYTPMYDLFYKLFPFFRFPAKFLCLASLSLLVMAAYGLDRLILLLKQKGLRTKPLFLVIALILVADLYVNHANLNPLRKSTFYESYHPYLKPIIDDSDIFRIYLDPDATTPDSQKDTILNHHIRWQMYLMPNLGILHGLDHIDGKTGLELRYQYIITEILQRPWDERLRFLRLANVKYVISSQRLDQRPALRGRIKKINPIVYEIKDFLPRAWMVGHLRSIMKGTVDELIDDSFDPSSSALAKGDAIGRHRKPSFREIDHIQYEKNGNIYIELTTDVPCVLVISESSYPGWRVFVDGEEKPCLWLNLLFQGVEIGPGTHKIKFIFRPKHFGTFLFASLGTLLFLLVAWFCYRLCLRRHAISSKQIVPTNERSTE